MKKVLFPLWKLYHDNTKLHPHLVDYPVVSEEELQEHMLKRKEFPWVKEIPLSPKIKKVKGSLKEILKQRRSVRIFSSRPVGFQKVSTLLELSYGISGTIFLNGKSYNLRTSPSAGALYACCIYLLSINVKGLKPGVYYYNPDRHALSVFSEDREIESKFQRCLIQSDMFTNYQLVLVIVVDMKRISYKYGERGYRYALLDAGHIGENVYLVATGLNLGVVGVEGFYDEEVSTLLNLDSAEEIPVYVLLIGNK